MMTIQVLGAGCVKCERLANNAERAVRESGIDARVVKAREIETDKGSGENGITLRRKALANMGLRLMPGDRSGGHVDMSPSPSSFGSRAFRLDDPCSGAEAFQSTASIFILTPDEPRVFASLNVVRPRPLF